jgi:hypothetical protein
MGQEQSIKFCGHQISAEDLALIQELAVDFWGIPRSELAATVCELLCWERPNGQLKTRECIFFLEDLGARGWLKLPRKRNTVRGKARPIARTEDAREQAPIQGTLSQLGGVSLELVANKEQDKQFKELVDRYHYLGYKNPFGARLRYLIKCAAGRLLGCLQFTSPAWKVQARDRWIGWTAPEREAKLQHVVQNSRFLILPWVTVPHLASHVLGQSARRLPADWYEMYRVRPYLLETFVEERFAGTSYAAANWVKLGQTRGRGRMDKQHKNDKAIKSVWVLPLHRRAREILTIGS